MKTALILTAFLFFSAAARAALRTFTAQNGKTLKAEITGFNASKGRVEIRREDGKKISVAPEIFSEKDRKYIEKWLAADAFMSESVFVVEIDDEEKGYTKKEHEVDIGEEFSGGRRGGESGVITVAIDKHTKYAFKLTLQNKSDVQLNNVSMEYRIFYDQQKAVVDGKANKNRPEDSPRPESHMAVDQLKVKEGKARLKPAAPGSARMVEFAGVTLIERSASRAWGDKIDLKADLHGAWIRLSMKGPDGDVLTRDAATSNSITKKFSWNTPEELIVQND